MKFEKKTQQYNIRLSQAERKKLEAVAKHNLLSMAEVILLLVNREYERINEECDK